LNRFKGHHRIPLLRRLYDQRDQARSERDAAIAQRDQRTSERDAAIAQRDRRTRERDAAIAERDHLWSTLGNARPWITVYRDGEVFVLAVEEIDRFPFRNGDELSVEPSSQRDRWLRTPEGHVHVPVAPGVGVRVPPTITLFEFKGFSVPEHLIYLTGAGVASFDGIGRAHIYNYERIMCLFSEMTFLEIGSGAGRDAFQLLDRLGSEGRYIGIDVQRESIAWCQNNIGRQHPKRPVPPF
jgi:hypothetical protein